MYEQKNNTTIYNLAEQIEQIDKEYSSTRDSIKNTIHNEENSIRNIEKNKESIKEDIYKEPNIMNNLENGNDEDKSNPKHFDSNQEHNINDKKKILRKIMIKEKKIKMILKRIKKW